MKHLFRSLALALTLSAAGAQVVLTPTQDTDLYQFMGGYPTGTEYSLGVNASANAGHSQKTLIQFNPTAATLGMSATEIGKAVLRLYILEDAVPGSGYGGILAPGSLTVHTQTAAWSVSTVRWTSLSPGPSIGSITVTHPSTATTAVWVELDVTATVKAWAAGTTPNNGFLLQSASETDTPLLNVLFASMETGFKPQLVVTKAPPPPFTVTGFTMAGNDVSLTWNSVVGKSYLVRESSDLTNWSTRKTVVATTSQSSTTVTRTVFPEGKGFYRIELVP